MAGDQAPLLADSIPRAMVILLPEIGHMIHVGSRCMFSELVADFLTGERGVAGVGK